MRKSGVLGAKSKFLDLKKYEVATNLERPNGAKCRFLPKNRQNKRGEKLEIVALSLLFSLFFR